MKKDIFKTIWIIWISLAVFFLGQNLAAQQLNFFYVGPTATVDGTFGAGNTFGLTRDSSGVTVPAAFGYRAVVLTNANTASFYSIAPINLRRTYDSIRTASTALRSKLNRVMSLAGNRVETLAILLIDDRTGLPSNAPFRLSRQGGIRIAWPSARNWRDSTIGKYRGRINLGERASNIDLANAGGFKRWEATIIHEFSHTQMLRDTSGVNKWNDPSSAVRGIDISYGGDDGHWFVELQADEQSPMDEGLGYFWALEHNPPMAVELDTFLNTTTPRFWLGSRSVLTGWPDMWNAPNTVVCTGLPCILPHGDTLDMTLNTQLTPNTGSYELRSYKWLDVPAKYCFYNELMSEAYFYLFHKYGFNTRDTAYNKIYDAVKTMCIIPNQLYRYPANAANMLANSLEAYARSAAGQLEATNGTLVSSMFAYALYDLIGHFGMTEADLRRQFDINSASHVPHIPKPLAFTHYWARRNDIMRLACPHLGGNNCLPGAGAINVNAAVTAIRDYFRNPATILR